LRSGAKAPLRATRDGPPVAELVVPVQTPAAKPPKGASASERAKLEISQVLLAESYEVGVLERAGARIRLEIVGPDASVEAWTDANVVTTAQTLAQMGPRMMGVLRALDGGAIVGGLKRMRCLKDVPLYVEVLEQKVRVGEIRAGADFFAASPTSSGRQFIQLSLPNGPFESAPKLSAQPFTESTTTANCQ
jgi:hypothetical protein